MFDLIAMKEALEKCPECVSVEMNNGKLPVNGNPLVAVIRSPVKYLWPDLDRDEIEDFAKRLLRWIDLEPDLLVGFESGWLTGIHNVIQENRYLIWEYYMRRDANYKPKNAFSNPFPGSQFELDYYAAAKDSNYGEAIETMVCETEFFPLEDIAVLNAYFRWRTANTGKADSCEV